MAPQFSLITSTLNRTWQLERFLHHLNQQDFRGFECIIVDQNEDDRLLPIINKFKDNFTIIHLHSARGVSLGRNVGIENSSGDIIAFPDDDCWYANDLLEKVVKLFVETPEVDVISGRPINEHGKTSLGKYDRKPGKINKLNVWQRANANTLFLRRRVVDKVEFFDEDLGPGAGTKWGAAEDIDYPIRALQKGFVLFYFPELTVYHEAPIIEYNEAAIKRGHSYALGMGRVLKKHRYPLGFVLVKLFYQIGGMLLALANLDIQRFKYHRAVFKGRLKGWLAPFTD